MKAESNASEEESGEGIRLCQAKCKKIFESVQNHCHASVGRNPVSAAVS